MDASRRPGWKLVVPLTLAICLAGFSLMFFVGPKTPEPSPAPKKPKKGPGSLPSAAEVLPSLVGVWSVEGEITTPAGGGKTRGIAAITPVAGGRFIRIHGLDDDPAREHLAVQGHEPKKGQFRSWSFDAFGESGQGTGEWDATSQTLSWKTSLPGRMAFHHLRMLNENQIKARLAHRDAADRDVLEVHQTWTRLKPGDTPAFKPAPPEAKHPKEMEVLERFLIGEWIAHSNYKTLVPPLSETRMTSTVRARPILGARFIEGHEETQPGDRQDYWLATYDAATGAYRQWQFSSGGDVWERAGTFDERLDVLHWTPADKQNYHAMWRRLSKDEQRVTIQYLDEKGEPAAELSGIRKRK